MVLGVIDQAVVGKDDALCTPLVGAQRVDVTLGVASAVLFGENALIVSEMAAADAFAGGIRLERPAGPAELFCFLLRDEVGGQVSVGMQIQRDVVLRGIDAVFADGGRFGSSFCRFFGCGFLIGCLRRFFGSFFCRFLRFGGGQSGRLGVLFGIVQDLGNLLDGLRGFF